MSKFVVHQTNLGSTELTYLTGTNQVIDAGFAANSPAYAAAVNAILHETSVVVTGIMNALSNTTGWSALTPESSVTDIEDAFDDTIAEMVALDYCELNNQTYTFDINRDDPTDFPHFYAPITLEENAVLIGGPDDAPIWSDLYVTAVSADGMQHVVLYNGYSGANTPDGIWIGTPSKTCNFGVNGDTCLKKTTIDQAQLIIDDAVDAAAILDAAVRVNGGIGIGYRLAASSSIALNIDDALTITKAGALTTSAGITAASYNIASDRNLKENITDFVPSKSILDLPIKQYDFKKDGSHHIGCIAQDLQEICPEIVHVRPDGYLSIEETKIVYLLLDEVKKLRKELNELKGKK